MRNPRNSAIGLIFPPHRPQRAGARAFTLVEMLVVVAVIAILIGIVVFAMKHVIIGQGNNTTSVQLQSLRGLIAELETTGKLASRQPPQMWVNGTKVAPSDIWSTADPAAANQPAPLPSPGDVTMTAWDSGDPNLANRFNSDAVANTQLVMGQLRAVPNNRSAIDKLPPDQLLANPERGVTAPKHPINTKLTTDPAGSAGGAISPPIPVDAWQNPIIFVPSGGLRVAITWKAEIYKKGTLVSDSNKLFRAKKATGGAGTSDTDVWEPYSGPGTVTSPDNRPFFASAGPDGDFRTPDDNLYSFQQ